MNSDTIQTYMSTDFFLRKASFRELGQKHKWNDYIGRLNRLAVAGIPVLKKNIAIGFNDLFLHGNAFLHYNRK